VFTHFHLPSSESKAPTPPIAVAFYPLCKGNLLLFPNQSTNKLPLSEALNSLPLIGAGGVDKTKIE